MSRIAYYAKSLEKFGAQGVLLQSNQSVTLRFPTGDRHASQQTPHQMVVQMVQEVAPRDLMTRLESGQASRFEIEDGGARFVVTVQLAPGGMAVLIEPAGKLPPAPPPRPAAPLEAPVVEADAPAAYEEIPIERTSYEAVDVAGSSSFLDDLLRNMRKLGASDLHLSTGSPPMIRLHGDMTAVAGRPALDGDTLLRELSAIAPVMNRQEFEERNDTDFAYALPGVSRFRVNVFRDRNGPGAVLRAIPFEIPDPKKLGVPEQVLKLCDLTKGLVVVTGPTGSGKSTTLAALIDHINQTRSAHIITIEDPVEFIHPNKKCLINQREVRTHTRSFKDALRAALREDPDIVLVGEMRDLETIAIAVETAETGHLVFGTLHTTTAPGTVDRIVDQFPPDRQEQIRMMLSESLAGVIAQVLCKKIGGGRVAAYEVLLGNSAVSNLIRERKTFQLFSVMQTSRNQGMTTMNDHLVDLVRKKLIEPHEAYYKAVNKAEIKGLLSKIGHEVG
jgi:twitching motility protein PilT